MSIEGTVGGSEQGPTADAEGVALAEGDTVKIIHMDDPLLSRFLGKEAHVEWVQDIYPFSQVFLIVGTLDENPPSPDGWESISTYSAWTRKVGGV